MTLTARHLFVALGLLGLGQPFALRAMEGTDEKLPSKSRSVSNRPASFREFLEQLKAEQIQAPSRTPSADELMGAIRVFIGYCIRQDPELTNLLPEWKHDPHQERGYDPGNNSGLDWFLEACGIRSGHTVAIWHFLETCEAERKKAYLEAFEESSTRINEWDLTWRLQAILRKDGLWPRQQEVSSSSSSSSSQPVLAMTLVTSSSDRSPACSTKASSGDDEAILKAYLAWRLSSLDGELSQVLFQDEPAETALVMEIFDITGKGVDDLKAELRDAEQMDEIPGHLETFKAIGPAIPVQEILRGLPKVGGIRFTRLVNSSIFLPVNHFLPILQEAEDPGGNAVMEEEKEEKEEKGNGSSSGRNADSLT